MSVLVSDWSTTFEPHPQKVFEGDEAPALLTTLSQKISLIESLGIVATIVCPFDERIYQYTAAQFFSEILIAKLGTVHMVEGEDFTFGRGRSGSADLLKALGRDHGVEVSIVDPVILDGEKIRSTRIRACIQEGSVAKARSLLGRSYEVEGRKTRGKGRGRTLGYPTVNLVPKNELLPGIGIYAGEVEIGAGVFMGAASLGFNPTFGGDRFSFEIYLLDFSGEVRDGCLRARFHERLRDEIRFDSGQDLRQQMELDVARVREIFSKGGNYA